MQNKTITIPKKAVYIIIIAIVLIGIGAFYVNAEKAKKEEIEIKEYKKSLYESILCQHSCPLDNSTFFPEQQCVQQCLIELRDKNLSGDMYSNEDLLFDNLFPDMDFVLKDCRTRNAEQNEDGNYTLNNEAFFECARTGLLELQETYPYVEVADAENLAL